MRFITLVALLLNFEIVLFSQEDPFKLTGHLEMDSLDSIELIEEGVKKDVESNFLCCGYKYKIISFINDTLVKSQVDLKNISSRNALVLVILDRNGTIEDIQFPTAKDEFLNTLNSVKGPIKAGLNVRKNFDPSYVDLEMNDKEIKRFLLKLRFGDSGLVADLETRVN